MKKFIIIMILILSLTGVASAYQIEGLPDNGIPIVPNDWNRYDTALQVVFVALSAVDRYQTSHGVSQGDGKYEEVGWARYFIGSHPTSGQVNKYFYLGITAHTAVAMAIPKDWTIMDVPARNIWQLFWIGVEAHATYNNYQLGLQYRFW